jgi:hypothetical protein
MKLFIHCGLHKTATSSFQNLCIKNQSKLSECGVYYPKYANRYNHSLIIHDVQRYNINVTERFFAKVYSDANPKCHTVLISGEDFENCIVDLALANEIETAAENSGFESVTWIVVTRNQIDLLKSLYAESSKHDVVLDFEMMKNAALKSGCFYLTTFNYNYIFVLDYSRFEARFKYGTSGNNVQIEYDDFLKGFVGRAIFALMMSELEFEDFKKIAEFSEKHANKRSSNLTVEARYLKTALYSHIKLLCDCVMPRKLKSFVRKLHKAISSRKEEL